MIFTRISTCMERNVLEFQQSRSILLATYNAEHPSAADYPRDYHSHCL